MPRKKNWKKSEEKLLIEKYHDHTIKELMVFLDRSEEAINNKIKSLKSAGKIKSGKTDDTIKRAYRQRS